MTQMPLELYGSAIPLPVHYPMREERLGTAVIRVPDTRALLGRSAKIASLVRGSIRYREWARTIESDRKWFRKRMRELALWSRVLAGQLHERDERLSDDNIGPPTF
jgi:hypothetical protein